MNFSVIVIIIIVYRVLKMLKNTQDKESGKKGRPVSQKNTNQMKNSQSHRSSVRTNENNYSRGNKKEYDLNSHKNKFNRETSKNKYIQNDSMKKNIAKDDLQNPVEKRDEISESNLEQLGVDTLFPEVLYAGLKYGDVQDQVPDYVSSYLDFNFEER